MVGQTFKGCVAEIHVHLEKLRSVVGTKNMVLISIHVGKTEASGHGNVGARTPECVSLL